MHRRILIALIVALAFPATWSSAGSTEAEAAQASLLARIKIVMRQRVLVQRMAKASCFVMGGIRSDYHADMGWMAVGEFGDALQTFMAGDDAQGFIPETNAEIRHQLDVMVRQWQTLGPAALQIIHLDLHSVVMHQMLELNGPVLQGMDETLRLIETVYGKGQISPALARTLNMAGRQGMLTQKVAKEACFVFLGVKTEVHVADLAESLAEFDGTLENLIAGANGMIAPPNSSTIMQLKRTKAAWAPLKAILERAVAGESLSLEELTEVARQNDLLLRETTAVLRAYFSQV